MNKERLKEHFSRHKVEYILGGVIVVLSATCIVLACKKSGTTNIVNASDHSQGLIGSTIVNLERRGHPGNVIRCIETGEIFASQNRAAELLGLCPAKLSKHLHGLREHVDGLTFEVLGECQ